MYALMCTRPDICFVVGNAFLLNGAAISWSSKKQSCIALSTMESEYIACAATV